MFSFKFVPSTKRVGLFNDSMEASDVLCARLWNCADALADYGLALEVRVDGEVQTFTWGALRFAVETLPDLLCSLARNEPLLIDLNPQTSEDIHLEPAVGGYSVHWYGQSSFVSKKELQYQLVDMLDKFRMVVEWADPALSRSESYRKWLSVDEYASETSIPFTAVAGRDLDVFHEKVPPFERGFNFFHVQLIPIADQIRAAFPDVLEKLVPFPSRGFAGTIKLEGILFDFSLENIVFSPHRDGDFEILVEREDFSFNFCGSFLTIGGDLEAGFKTVAEVWSRRSV